MGSCVSANQQIAPGLAKAPKSSETGGNSVKGAGLLSNGPASAIEEVNDERGLKVKKVKPLPKTQTVKASLGSPKTKIVSDVSLLDELVHFSASLERDLQMTHTPGSSSSEVDLGAFYTPVDLLTKDLVYYASPGDSGESLENSCDLNSLNMNKNKNKTDKIDSPLLRCLLNERTLLEESARKVITSTSGSSSESKNKNKKGVITSEGTGTVDAFDDFDDFDDFHDRQPITDTGEFSITWVNDALAGAVTLQDMIIKFADKADGGIDGGTGNGLGPFNESPSRVLAVVELALSWLQREIGRHFQLALLPLAGKSKIEGWVYLSILVLSYFMRSGALDSSGILQSYSIISLA